MFNLWALLPSAAQLIVVIGIGFLWKGTKYSTGIGQCETTNQYRATLPDGVENACPFLENTVLY